MTEKLQQFASIYPGIFLSDFLRYFLAASPLAALLFWLRPAGLAGRKLQSRSPTKAGMRREFKYSVLTAAIFALNGYGIFLGIEHGIVEIYEAPDTYGWLWLGLSFPVILIAHDTYFYWTHRAMHHPKLFRWFHRTHHRSHTPTPWAAYAFDPGEAWVQAAFLPLYLVLAPTHGAVVFAFLIFMIARNVMGHAGHELHPRWWLGNPLTRFHNTTAHHDLHHETGRWNYGLYFTWWDRLMGTEHPDYRERFQAAWQAMPPEQPPRFTVGIGAIAALLAVSAVPGETYAAEIEDVWITPGYGSLVRIMPCAGDPKTLCGEVIWLLAAADQPGTPTRDTKNPDPELRGRPLLGISLLSDFLRGADVLEGRIYNPEDGKTYRAKMHLAGEDVLSVSGCILMFCDTQVWYRARPALAAASRAMNAGNSPQSVPR